MLPDLGALYEDHAPSVWRYARARLPTDADAEDVTSDVFIRAARSTHTFDPERGSPRAWLMGIARNAAADWWRRRTPDAPNARVPDVPGDEDDPADEVLRTDAVDTLRKVLGMLSEREAEAIALRFGAELSSADIGAALGISPTAARMLVHRAVTRLRGVLQDG
ncbi:MAG TPA: sigma-70 family RNA polymerase sigma factor [Acidimicrobiales bacterium]|jgi:RNA polymerase sigma-70 factor (ECF subfamily)|nr:sigma-70 family RNA polymerase sigma factor [Acidimicrobiales bacterium]